MTSARTLVGLHERMQGREPGPILLALARYFLVGPALDDVELPRDTRTGDFTRRGFELEPREMVFHPVTKTGRNKEGTVLIGRAAFNDIVLLDASVSRSHASLNRRQDGSYGFCDLGSKARSRVNAVPAPLDGESPKKLRARDKLHVGEVPMVWADHKMMIDWLAKLD